MSSRKAKKISDESIIRLVETNITPLDMQSKFIYFYILYRSYYRFIIYVSTFIFKYLYIENLILMKFPTKRVPSEICAAAWYIQEAPQRPITLDETPARSTSVSIRIPSQQSYHPRNPGSVWPTNTTRRRCSPAREKAGSAAPEQPSLSWSDAHFRLQPRRHTMGKTDDPPASVHAANRDIKHTDA